MAAIPPDELFLTNDAAGYAYHTRFAFPGFVSEASAHGASTTLTEVFTVPNGYSGEITDVQIGVVLPAVSASGFVSGTVDATLRINSVAVCSTNPSIAMAGSAGQAYRAFTMSNLSGVASGIVTLGVVNTASAVFTAGDQISIDMNARSVGSAAAGAAGKGLYAVVKYRFKVR